MHPDRRFRADADWLDFAAARGFAHIFASTGDGPMVVHAPLTRAGDALHFHVSRANRIAPQLAGAAVVASVSTMDGYISPNWYEQPGDQVPTWNFVAVEFAGVAHPLEEPALIAQLDALAERHEPAANPWRRTKTAPAVFTRMLRGIVGFELRVGTIRETVKLSQNKTGADRAGVAAGLRALGNAALADAVAAA